MKYLRHLLIISLIIAGFSVIASATKKAYAATSDTAIAQTGPVPLSAEYYPPGGTNFTPNFAVGTGGYDGQYMYTKIYVNANAAGKNEATTVTIHNGDGICNSELGAPSVDFHIEDLSTNETYESGTYLGFNGNTSSNPSHGCGNLSINIPANSGYASAYSNHKQWAVFYFEAGITNKTGANEKQFYLSVPNGLIGLSRPVRDYGFSPTDGHDRGYFAIYNYGGSGNWDYGFQIAPRCNEDVTDTAVPSSNIGIYDADNFTYDQPNLQYTVLRDAKGAGAPSWSAPIANVGRAGLGDNHQYNTQSMSFTANAANRYKINFYDIAPINTIQIKIPFDQIDASAAALCPPPTCQDPAATNFGGPLPCKYPTNPISTKCNIVYPNPAYRYIDTAPSSPVNFSITVTNGETYTFNSPATKLYITGPTGVTGSFNLPGIAPGASATISVSITNVPGTAGIYNSYRTYRVGSSQTNTFGGSCSPNLNVGPVPTTVVPSGDLYQASCQAIAGHVWINETDASTPTIGRLHITAPGQDAYTGSIVTAFTQPHNTGGHWFAIDPYDYLPGVQLGPSIDVQLDYHHQYTISLQVQDSAGNWSDATNPNGTATSMIMQYPCITGTIAAHCNLAAGDVQGTLSYLSTSTSNTTGVVNSDGVSSAVFSAHYNYGPYDPFSAPTMNIQLLPHVGHNFQLFFRDFDGGYYPALNSDGSAQVTTSLDPCLTFSGCSPSPVTFEVTTSTPRTFTMGYINNTDDAFPGYYGVMNSYSTVRINGGTGPINSIPGVKAPPPTTNSLTWPAVSVSSSGAPYDGFINLVPYYGSSPIGGSNCPITVYQVTKPYFKAFGSSVSTGGAFAPASSPTSASCTGGQNAGGARGFAHFGPPAYSQPNPNSYASGSGKSGASVEYSIESLGLIQGANSGGYGFYSGDTHDAAGDLINTLDLGNQGPPANGWGGMLGGGHCVQNYYCANISTGCAAGTPAETPWGNRSVSDMFTSATTHPDDNGVLIRAQAFQASPGAGNSITLDGGSPLPANTRATLFVDGDVYISHNITYSPVTYNPASVAADGSNPTAPPYFALIATGSIYVDPSVTQLDGLYVAQGQGGNKDGFSTCGTASGNVPKASLWPTCSTPLSVNGAVVASQLKLLRIGTENNTLNKATADTGSKLRGKTDNAVEEFNYTPNMLESFPYYLTTSVSNIGSTEKLFSLPPVY